MSPRNKTTLVIMANSYRDGERCVAGIDVKTGEWVRPVSGPEGKPVTWDMRNVGGEEPQLLDVVEMSLQSHGPDLGCQPENRILHSERWKKVGILTAKKAAAYCENAETILHNHDNFVDLAYFATIPKRQWKSLQLVRPTSVEFYATTWENKKRWRVLLRHGKNNQLDLPLTDPKAIERLNSSEAISPNCLLTISLGGPWPSDSVTPKCYKLVAGVIEQ